MFPKTSLTTTLLMLAFTVFSQTTSQIIFSRLTKKEGLASNTIFQTVQDRQGFLWVATQNGLQRFDGHRFITFRHLPGDSMSIPENDVSHLFKDSKDRLWVVFDKSLGLFDTKKFRFSAIPLTKPVNMIKRIIEDPEQHVVVFADNQQFSFNESTRAFTTGYLPAPPEGYTVSDMAVDPGSRHYLLTGKQGSLLFNPDNQAFSSKEKNNSGIRAFDSLSAITNARYPFIARDGSWWLVNWIPFSGAAPVIYHYDKRQDRRQQFEKLRAYQADSYYEVWGLFEQSNGTIWAYGMGLLAYFDPQKKRFIHISSDVFRQNGIEYDMVSGLYEDRNRNVWISTNNGLYRFNTDAQVFRNYVNERVADTTRHQQAVSAIVQPRGNELWVSTWGAGVFSYDSALRPIPNVFTDAAPSNRNLQILAMMKRRNGEVWMGTQNGEIKIVQPATGKIRSFFHEKFSGQMIRQLLEDKDGNTWIASGSGVVLKCNNGQWTDSSKFTTILTDVDDIFKLYQDKTGNIWICTASSGVYTADYKTGKILLQINETTTEKDGLLNDGATDIVQYNDSLMLIASDGLCIYNLRSKQFRYLTPADGLPPEHITSLIVDQKNRLWVACDGGLYRLDIYQKLFTAYDATDGITNDIFQVSSAALLDDGRIAIGTPYDFIIFDPEKTIPRKDIPSVNIAGITLESKQLPVDSVLQQQRLALSYDKTFLQISLSTLSYNSRYTMYYMLDGLDREWKPVTGNEIIYQYIPPGTYKLNLKSQDGDGKFSKETTFLNIYVHAPFWRTWWFYGIILLLTGGIFFWLDHKRLRRKAAIFEMRSKITDGLHKEINEALTSINILSEMAKIKAVKEPGRSTALVDQIHEKSQQVTIAMNDILWSIDPENDNMANFISRLREYVNTLSHEKNINIELIAEKRALHLPINMNIRNDVYSFFKSGITGIVHSGGTRCQINIRYEKPNLIYKLRFDKSYVDERSLNDFLSHHEFGITVKKLRARIDLKQKDTTAIFIACIPFDKNDII